MSKVVFAQNEKEPLPYGNGSVYMRDTIPDISLEKDTTLKKRKKTKGPKRHVFYGKKSRKGYTRIGLDQKQVVELFYVLKKNVEPTGYVDGIYVWDITKAKVVRVRKEELPKLVKYKILHGPYTKYVGGRMMETGIFYIGTKHGRWEKYKWEKKWWEKPVPGKYYNKYNQDELLQPILMGKAKYYKGFQKEAKVSYYDFDQTKVKEVIPYEFGEKTGDYYFFLENGQPVVKGHYGDGKKIGLWVEYFEDTHKKKRETQYPKDQWDIVEPVIMKEWDSKGNLIITNGEKVDPKKIEKDPVKKLLKRKR